MRLRRSTPRSRSAAAVTGLDIQPGEIVAAQVDAGMAVERAVTAPLAAGIVREGEVVDVEGLATALKALFAEHKLPSRVRVGLASQRAVMRTLDLPPLEDERDIAAAIRLQAPEHIAMPLSQAVIDHHTIGIVDTPEGRRTRVVVVAAQRDAVDRLLAALRRAGLRPEGIDLSAFALLRGLHSARAAEGPVLYAQVAGVTTLAIARGARCELTRVAPVGLEVLAERLAEREGIVVGAARERLLAYGREGGAADDQALAVLDHGLSELADELRNTIEFHAAQLGGEPVGEVVLTGPAAAIPSFCTVLEQHLATPVRQGAPIPAGPTALAGVDPARVSVAAGLAVEEVAA